MTSGTALPSAGRAVATAAAALGLLLAGAGLQGANAGGQVNAGADAGQFDAGRAGTRSMAATQTVKLGLNKSVVIDLPADAYDILVANPAVADAVTRTARRIYLFGKSVGETNIFVFGPGGEQIVSLDLTVERDTAGVEEYIKRFIPTSDVKVELINDNVVLDRHGRYAARRGPRRADRQHAGARRRSDDGPVCADGRSQQRRRRRCHRQPRLQPPGQRHRQPDPDHRRRPGDAEGHGRRDQPQRHEGSSMST